MPNSDFCSFIWRSQSGCLLLEEAAWKGWWYDTHCHLEFISPLYVI